LINLLKSLKSVIGKNVEIEGALNTENFSLFQLNESVKLEQKLIKLTSGINSESQLFSKGIIDSAGYGRFEGRSVISDKIVSVPSSDILVYTGDITQENFENLLKFDYKQLVFSMKNNTFKDSDKMRYEFDHYFYIYNFMEKNKK
jgi:hypothetical protein